MLRKMEEQDLRACAEILCAVYNNECWQCRWEVDTANAYLKDFFKADKSACFVTVMDGSIAGALFCREKIWWNNSELVVEEMFVRPELQRNGLGTSLLNKAEEYVREHGLAGMTLATNRYAPAPAFYKKNGFVEYGHVLFMGKEI